MRAFILLGMLTAAVAVTADTVPAYHAVAGWPTSPGTRLATCTATSRSVPSGEVYLSVQDPDVGLQVFAADGRSCAPFQTRPATSTASSLSRSRRRVPCRRPAPRADRRQDDARGQGRPDHSLVRVSRIAQGSATPAAGSWRLR